MHLATACARLYLLFFAPPCCMVKTKSLFREDMAGAIGATYSRRVLPFVWAEAGVLAALEPTGAYMNRLGTFPIDSHSIWVPFGVRGTLPLPHRFEVSLGVGGVYEKFSVAQNYGVGPYPHDGWGGYLNPSAAFALDRKRHFWLGASPRFFFINGSSSDRWLMFTGDLGFRF
jgi:hypothetical protein